VLDRISLSKGETVAESELLLGSTRKWNATAIAVPTPHQPAEARTSGELVA